MQDWLGEFGWTAALDVAIVAALIYGVIVWLRRSRGQLVAAGVAGLAGLYALAASFGLDLVTHVFQTLAAGLLLAGVIVFQDELRQGFEALAAWALRRRIDPRPRLDTRDILVETLFDLARRKVGALVVLPGRQPLERHLQGGVRLDGRLSTALLSSLFDPHSDGHDGAVLIENRQVLRFGAHLPLSRGPTAPGLGTRHSAALGLVERSDAVCLVVSEERGRVSLAALGRLREATTPSELGRWIDEFYRQVHPLSRPRRSLLRAWTGHWPAKALAVVTSLLLWTIWVPGSRSIETTLEVPVKVTGLPPGWIVTAVDPPRLRAVVRATRRDLLWMDRDALRVDLNAAAATRGRRSYPVTERDVSAPDGIVLRRLETHRVRLDLRRGAARAPAR
ncbi:MAG: diadenylate cyclase [Myxococcota bacterium]